MESALTVIIPNYNNSVFLEQCIDSVMKQSFKPQEVIVFDDCSTDNSREILSAYEKKYDILRCIFSERNVGVSAARHTAILNAKTPFITVLDADDYYISEDKLLYEMEALQHYNSKQKYVCAFSQVIRVDEAGKAIDCLKLKKLGSHTRFRTVTRSYAINVPRDFCFAKEAYMLTGGYRFDSKLFEDWDLVLRLLPYSEFVFSNSLGTAYRQKEEGLSRVGYMEKLHAKIEVFERNKENVHYTFLECISFYFILYLALCKNMLKACLK